MTWVETMFTIVASIAASSGFWAYILRKSEKTDARTRMLIGLGHDRITDLGLRYIERGWITQDEYENLNDYLYLPYLEMLGKKTNGSATKIMNEVSRLPICKPKYTTKKDCPAGQALTERTA